MVFIYVTGSIVAAIANSLTYKVMLNKYKAQGHNYEFFANQANVFIYVLFCCVVLTFKALQVGPRRWLSKQRIPWTKFFYMGCLDAASGFLSTIGGAFVAGSLQNLLNQCIIPATILMSYLFLNEKVSRTQALGSLGIVAGASVSALPALLSQTNTAKTTTTGVVVFLLGIFPSAASNVYKECAFRNADDLSVDINLLSAIVATFQVLVGFMLLPVLALPAFGGVSLTDIPSQLSGGFQCFFGRNSLPGDHCGGSGVWLHTATSVMLNYCIINFAYNLLQLLGEWPLSKGADPHSPCAVCSLILRFFVTSNKTRQRSIDGGFVGARSSYYEFSFLVAIPHGFVMHLCSVLLDLLPVLCSFLLHKAIIRRA